MGKRKSKGSDVQALTHRPFVQLDEELLASGDAEPVPEEHLPEEPIVFDDDDRLLETAMADVTPLAEDPKLIEKIPRAKPMPASADEDLLVMQRLDEIVFGEVPFNIADSEEYVEAAVTDLDRRVVQRLRRGEYSVQAHVDLHGLNRDQARLRVAEFIRKCRSEGKRCVLIIHGRGIGSKDNIPVLKNKLVAWLTRGAIGRSVLAFASARPFDGGTGAVYVLLRN